MASISRKLLTEAIRSSGDLSNTEASFERCMFFFSEYHGIQQLDIPEEIQEKIKSTMYSFLYRLKGKWIACSRNKSQFERKNGEWLQAEMSFPLEVDHWLSKVKGVSRSDEGASGSGAGRPSKDWTLLSKRSKQRRAQTLLQESEHRELLFAASQGAYGRNPDLRYVLQFTIQSPSKPAKLRKLISSPPPAPEKFTPDEALALLIETGLTKSAYQTLRTAAKEKKADVYPPYNAVREAKQKCYPQNIDVSGDSAKVSLQSLLDHTALRILEQRQDNVHELIEKVPKDERPLFLDLICKWGFDGSSGQSEYKQRFTTTEQSDDSSLFCTTLVPLQLKYKDQVIWENPVPSSTRFCRPIHLQYKKETPELSQEEHQNKETEIQQLQPIAVDLDIQVEGELARKETVNVKYNLHFTMVDQKVINAITKTSSTMRCYICGATPKDFNNIHHLPQPVSDRYKFGLCPLHKWIRCFEMMLHIAYRLPFQKWRIQSDEDRSVMAERKKKIQELFRSQLGLKVDQPKPGYGTSNDGNTARRAFNDETKFSKICGLDENLIHRFHIILIALSSGLPIDPKKFGPYCLDTAKLCIELYPWFKMPVSVHVLLIHGAQIISSSVLPIGMMSEEAQEARNKDNKLFRLRYARKTSRVHTMSDVFHRLMVTGDIVISSKSVYNRKKRTPVPPEVREMTREPELVILVEGEYSLIPTHNPSDSSESDSS